MSTYLASVILLLLCLSFVGVIIYYHLKGMSGRIYTLEAWGRSYSLAVPW